MIVDEAGQKGTGKWTAQIAIDIGIPIPTMQAALDARVISAHRNQRDEAHEQCRGDREEEEARTEALMQEVARQKGGLEDPRDEAYALSGLR